MSGKFFIGHYYIKVCNKITNPAEIIQWGLFGLVIVYVSILCYLYILHYAQ